ncbi:hypothetical protein HKD37_15G043420 [Glycine soja]|nr:hypothetical protein GmHk_15G044458 [Glycine max]
MRKAPTSFYFEIIGSALSTCRGAKPGSLSAVTELIFSKALYLYPPLLHCFVLKCFDIASFASSYSALHIQMASRKRKAPSTPTQVKFDKSRFTSQEALERYTDVIVPRKLLPERNVVVYSTEFDEFLDELARRHWDEELTDFINGNLYDPEDKSPKFALLRPNPQELATKLCIPGRGFELNADGYPVKILRKNMTTLAQTWSVLSFSNFIPTSHTSDVTPDKARLIYGIIMKMDLNVGGVQSDSRSLESLSPTINLAYIKKNCWNLDDPTVTFRGPRKAGGKRSEAHSTSAPLEAPTPSSSRAPPSSST